MPFSAGNGELQIVGCQDIGSLGDEKGPPTVVHWKWYYALPGMVFWGLALLPLVLARENRRLQAWAVFIPLLIVIIFWNWTTILFGFSSSNSEMFGLLVVAVASA